MKTTMRQPLGLLIFTLSIITFDSTTSSAQEGTTYMRIAKITVDSAKLDEYKTALKEQMQSALQLEKGVWGYVAVQDKKNPSKITIMETYASVDAYQAHIQTDHFKKYKVCVAGMVKQLELIDVIPISIQLKSNPK
ncbi:MAG: antibiotic biosynthesis monooxygenase [Bacteroidetes bacterium]|nr:antibiotic biosynthesis monooxygenase [Bacteroidota bacterium]